MFVEKLRYVPLDEQAEFFVILKKILFFQIIAYQIFFDKKS